MTKTKGKPGRHLSNEDREEIRELHRQGASALKIARLTGVSFNTAAKWARAKSLPVKPAFPAEKVLELLRQRVSQKKISRTLKVPFRKVQVFARANGFGRPHWHPTQDQTLAIIELVLSHEHSVAQISRMVHSPYDSTRKMVKVILQCQKLISGGQGVVGLDSYFPSRYRSPLKPAEAQQDVLTAQQREELALFMVDLVRRAAGKLVEDAQVIETATLTVTTLYLRANPTAKLGPLEWEKIRNYFEPDFKEAITTLRTAETGWTN